MRLYLVPKAQEGDGRPLRQDHGPSSRQAEQVTRRRPRRGRPVRGAAGRRSQAEAQRASRPPATSLDGERAERLAEANAAHRRAALRPPRPRPRRRRPAAAADVEDAVRSVASRAGRAEHRPAPGRRPSCDGAVADVIERRGQPMIAVVTASSPGCRPRSTADRRQGYARRTRGSGPRATSSSSARSPRSSSSPCSCWKAGPLVKKAFAGRTERIQGELDGAAKAETRRRAPTPTRIRQALGDIDAERARLLAEADAQAEALLADGRARLEAEIAELHAKADADIAAARQPRRRRAARRDRPTSRRPPPTASSSSSIDAETQQRLVEDFISRVGAGATA